MRASVLCTGGKSSQQGSILGYIWQPRNPLEHAGRQQHIDKATVPKAQRTQKVLEALAPASDWIVMGPGCQEDAVACARRLKTGRFEVALILPEQLEKLTEELSGSVDRDGHYASLPLHPEVLKHLGVKSHVYAISSAADAAEFIAGCHMSECPVCRLRFPGSPLEDGVCLNCYVTRDTAAPEEPCVVCQVENKFELHGKMLVACAQCKKHTCVACRDKHFKVARSYSCPACRRECGISHWEGEFRVCWYEP
jgi:hypothetical protein